MSNAVPTSTAHANPKARTCAGCRKSGCCRDLLTRVRSAILNTGRLSSVCPAAVRLPRGSGLAGARLRVCPQIPRNLSRAPSLHVVVELTYHSAVNTEGGRHRCVPVMSGSRRMERALLPRRRISGRPASELATQFPEAMGQDRRGCSGERPLVLAGQALPR